MAYVHLSSILDGQAPITRGTVLGQGIMSILYIMCMLIYFLKKKEVYIQFSLLDVYLYFFVFYNLYIYNVRLTIYHDILCYHSFPPLFLLLSLLLSFFYHEEIYLSKEKQCYLFVMLPCKYKSSTSCKSHSLSCKNLLVSVKSLSQMFMSHIRKCMFRLCVYLLGIYQSFYVHKVFLVCLQLIITDQRDSLNGFANEH